MLLLETLPYLVCTAKCPTAPKPWLVAPSSDSCKEIDTVKLYFPTAPPCPSMETALSAPDPPPLLSGHIGTPLLPAQSGVEGGRGLAGSSFLPVSLRFSGISPPSSFYCPGQEEKVHGERLPGYPLTQP